jgi:hypothetical protein
MAEIEQRRRNEEAGQDELNKRADVTVELPWCAFNEWRSLDPQRRTGARH